MVKISIIWTFAKTRTKQRYFLNSRIFTDTMSSSTFPSMLQMLNIHKVTYDFLIIFSFFFSIFILRIFLGTLPISASHEGPNTFHFLSPSSGNLIFRMNMPWISKVRTRQRNRVHPQGDQPVKHLESILRQELSAPESLRRRHAIQASSGSLVLVFCFVRSTWALSAGWSEHPDSLSCSFVCVSTMFASRITLKYLNALFVVSPGSWFLALDTALSSLSIHCNFCIAVLSMKIQIDRDLHQTWSHRGRPSVGSRPSWIWHSSETRPSLQNKRTVVVKSKHILDILHPVSMCVKDAILLWF